MQKFALSVPISAPERTHASSSVPTEPLSAPNLRQGCAKTSSSRAGGPKDAGDGPAGRQGVAGRVMGTNRSPQGPSALPIPLLPVRRSSSVQRLLLLPSRGRVPQLHKYTHVRHRTRLWPGWDHRSTQGWFRTPTKRTPISTWPQAPRSQRTGPTLQRLLAQGWQEAKVSSVHPHLPPEHGLKDAEHLLSPGLPFPRATSVQMPKPSWQRGSRGSSGTGTRQGLWREVAGGDTRSPFWRNHPQM